MSEPPAAAAVDLLVLEWRRYFRVSDPHTMLTKRFGRLVSCDFVDSSWELGKTSNGTKGRDSTWIASNCPLSQSALIL